MFTDVLSNSIRDVSVIELEWLKELSHNFYDFGDSNDQEMRESNYDGNIGNFN